MHKHADLHTFLFTIFCVSFSIDGFGSLFVMHIMCIAFFKWSYTSWDFIWFFFILGFECSLHSMCLDGIMPLHGNLNWLLHLIVCSIECFWVLNTDVYSTLHFIRHCWFVKQLMYSVTAMLRESPLHTQCGGKAEHERIYFLKKFCLLIRLPLAVKCRLLFKVAAMLLFLEAKKWVFPTSISPVN